jgi:SAM-dependent methyltransferase
VADPYANLSQAPADTQQRISDAMEARSVEPAQVALRRAYLSGIDLPQDALAVELGSGTGHVTCDLVDVAGASRAIGLEPSGLMVERAKTTHGDRSNIEFAVGDAKRTELPDASCNMVLMHTLLCHVPQPEDAITEAARILKPGGVLAICDGDYDTATAAIADFDPLDTLVKFLIRENVTNLHIMRGIGPLLQAAGFSLGRTQAHGYVAEGDATYFLTVIDRAADTMGERGLLNPRTVAALKAEARDRVDRKAFFGFMSYISVIAYKNGETG